jgi:hypothetical protein
MQTPNSSPTGQKKKFPWLVVIIIGVVLLLICVGVLLFPAISAMLFIASNPAGQLQDARNTQRSADIESIANAVKQYTSESGHKLSDFGNIPTCPATAQIGIGLNGIDLSAKLVDTYINEIPNDPLQTASNSNCGYTICTETNGLVKVVAPDAEGGKTITVEK